MKSRHLKGSASWFALLPAAMLGDLASLSRAQPPYFSVW